MLNLGVVVTFNNVSDEDFVLLAGVPPHLISSEKIDSSIFSVDAILFVDRLSKKFLQVDKKIFPEIFTLGFEFRQAGIRRLRDRNTDLNDPNTILKPRGMIFHVPPTNVETVFVYTLVYGVLSGSSNVVRISDRTGTVTEKLVEIISDTLLEPELADIASRVSVIRCDRDSQVLQTIALRSDLRVWWGGDQAVTALKKFESKPRTSDISFPDRWSVAVIDAGIFNGLDDEDSRNLLRNLSNDIYLFDQLACSSPQAIYWKSIDNDEFCRAVVKFDRLLIEAVYEMGYEIPFTNFIDKALKVAGDVLTSPGEVNWLGKELVSTSINDQVQNHKSQSGGALYHVEIDELQDLSNHVDSRVQTIVCFGIEKVEMKNALHEMKLSGIDRVVGPGKALSFGPIWDGIDLIASFTRKIDLSQF